MSAVRRTILYKLLPWVITAAALYFAFHSVDLAALMSHIGETNKAWLALAFGLTCASYIFRSRRWQFLFPEKCISFRDSARVLILGFFMNNILPARTGELVRAHMGARTTDSSRTLVLATIASERLVDGVTISLMFIAASYFIHDYQYAQELRYVALVFIGALAGVGCVLLLREKLFAFGNKLDERLNHRASSYTLEKAQVFINGLLPLFSPKRFPIISMWSLVIWSAEMFVYVAVSEAFGASMSLSMCVLFMVTVNFSSLIPAAPGGLGVIEAAATTVLVSLGFEKEQALAMALVQHMIQYLVVGVPGAFALLTWRHEVELAQQSSEIA